METFCVVRGGYFQYFQVMDLLRELFERCFSYVFQPAPLDHPIFCMPQAVDIRLCIPK